MKKYLICLMLLSVFLVGCDEQAPQNDAASSPDSAAGSNNAPIEVTR